MSTDAGLINIGIHLSGRPHEVGCHTYEDHEPILTFVPIVHGHVQVTLDTDLTPEAMRTVADRLLAAVESFHDAARAEADRREQSMQEAANDGFLDNADPDMDAAGADDYLDVPA